MDFRVSHETSLPHTKSCLRALLSYSHKLFPKILLYSKSFTFSSLPNHLNLSLFHIPPPYLPPHTHRKFRIYTLNSIPEAGRMYFIWQRGNNTENQRAILSSMNFPHPNLTVYSLMYLFAKMIT